VQVVGILLGIPETCHNGRVVDQGALSAPPRCQRRAQTGADGASPDGNGHLPRRLSVPGAIPPDVRHSPQRSSAESRGGCGPCGGPGPAIRTTFKAGSVAARLDKTMHVRSLSVMSKTGPKVLILGGRRSWARLRRMELLPARPRLRWRHNCAELRILRKTPKKVAGLQVRNPRSRRVEAPGSLVEGSCSAGCRCRLTKTRTHGPTEPDTVCGSSRFLQAPPLSPRPWTVPAQPSKKLCNS
jgi:hypothetical protein